jgi:23S rRNA (adenine2503-C2)-methyltransferase
MTATHPFGLSIPQLEAWCKKQGLQSYRGRQLATWMYTRRETDFSRMTDLPTLLRATWQRDAPIDLPAVDLERESKDGTVKWRLALADGEAVETVIMPMRQATGEKAERNTACISTQVGCALGCTFCATATLGLRRNLTAGEIAGQVLLVQRHLHPRRLTNIVFMGMGEPLDNLKAVLSTLEILNAEWGFGFSPKKVTVSTIGIIDGLDLLLEASDCRLALSLHSPFPDERADLIPYERRYPVMQVLDLFRRADLGRRRLTVEYLMIDGLNDSARHSKELSRILEGLGARVNLIPYHPIPDFPGTPSPAGRIETFRDDLNHRGQVATIRRSRGLDIDAACGLLTTKRPNS